MASSRSDRRRMRRGRATEVFGPHAEAALDVLTLLDLAWHDCYGEPTPPEQVVEDIWTVSDDLSQFVTAARVAVIDFRDLRMWADRVRAEEAR